MRASLAGPLAQRKPARPSVTWRGARRLATVQKVARPKPCDQRVRTLDRYRRDAGERRAHHQHRRRHGDHLGRLSIDEARSSRVAAGRYWRRPIASQVASGAVDRIEAAAVDAHQLARGGKRRLDGCDPAARCTARCGSAGLTPTGRLRSWRRHRATCDGGDVARNAGRRSAPTGCRRGDRQRWSGCGQLVGDGGSAGPLNAKALRPGSLTAAERRSSSCRHDDAAVQRCGRRPGRWRHERAAYRRHRAPPARSRCRVPRCHCRTRSRRAASRSTGCAPRCRAARWRC